jgi:hypothetical protein
MVLSSNILDYTPELIASWPAPNYDNPERIAWMPIYASVWFAAATLLVVVRIWLRSRGHAGQLGLDDVSSQFRSEVALQVAYKYRKAFLLPSWITALMFTITCITYTQMSQGDRHIWDVEPQLRSTAALHMWLAQLAFLLCSGFTKISILFFYRRLVSGSYSRACFWLVWFAIAFTIAYTVIFVIMLCIDCKPTSAYWMAFDIKYALTEDFSCLDDSTALNTSAGVCAAISDVYAVALPCIITWHHDVPRRQRIALNAIFSLGLVIVAASGVRTYWLIVTSYNDDVTRNTFNLMVWAQFELQAGIICASAPALRVFFRRYLGGGGGGHDGSQRSTTNIASGSITVIRDTSVTFDKDGSVVRASEKKQFHELRELSVSELRCEDGEDRPSSRFSGAGGRSTRYSHDEDSVGLSHGSQFPWSAVPAGRLGGGVEKGRL